MKTAIIHYWLLRMRGGEKVLEALCELFPDADIFTHVYDPRGISETIRTHKIQTTLIQKLPFARSNYQSYLPLMPMALEALDLRDYDLIISSESGPSKGVIVRPDALHICYCHSPMRYLWDQYHQYRARASMIQRLLMPWVMGPLRQWDVTSAARVDHFIANSTSVADRIKRYWRREADVLAPPVAVERFRPAERREDFYLYVGELAPYKRADLAVQACTMLNRRLLVIGQGSDEAYVRKLAGPTIEFLGPASDSILEEVYAKCQALLFPAEEDFGIVSVEAMAAGAPVVAFARGGARDTVIDGETGFFFAEQNVASLLTAMLRLESHIAQLDPWSIVAHAHKFNRNAFKSGFMRITEQLLDSRRRAGKRLGATRAPLLAFPPASHAHDGAAVQEQAER
jgi:glycosyltransferase involved in cell wall biosynthesis